MELACRLILQIQVAAYSIVVQVINAFMQVINAFEAYLLNCWLMLLWVQNGPFLGAKYHKHASVEQQSLFYSLLLVDLSSTVHVLAIHFKFAAAQGSEEHQCIDAAE